MARLPWLCADADKPDHDWRRCYACGLRQLAIGGAAIGLTMAGVWGTTRTPATRDTILCSTTWGTTSQPGWTSTWPGTGTGTGSGPGPGAGSWLRAGARPGTSTPTGSGYPRPQDLRLGPVDDAWLSTLEALHYWVLDFHLGQISQVPGAYALDLLEDDFPAYTALLDSQAALSTLIHWPTAEDLERLWQSRAFREDFSRALWTKHLADQADNIAWSRLNSLRESFGPGEGPEWERVRDADPIYSYEIQRRNGLWEQEAQQWRDLWQKHPSAYHHWDVLWCIAERHLE